MELASKAVHYRLCAMLAAEAVGWAIMLAAAGHIGVSPYHHHVLRDRVLSRILPSARAR
jgi:cytochrome b561